MRSSLVIPITSEYGRDQDGDCTTVKYSVDDDYEIGSIFGVVRLPIPGGSGYET